MTDYSDDLWDGGPQCPECDAPLYAYTCPNDDNYQTVFGLIQCTRCHWDYGVELGSDAEVLERMEMKVRGAHLPVWERDYPIHE